jgi:hypothetical protein
VERVCWMRLVRVQASCWVLREQTRLAGLGSSVGKPCWSAIPDHSNVFLLIAAHVCVVVGGLGLVAGGGCCGVGLRVV